MSFWSRTLIAGFVIVTAGSLAPAQVSFSTTTIPSGDSNLADLMRLLER